MFLIPGGEIHTLAQSLCEEGIGAIAVNQFFEAGQMVRILEESGFLECQSTGTFPTHNFPPE